MGTAIVTWIVDPRAVQETPEAVGRMLARVMAEAPAGALGVVIIGNRDEARRLADEVLRRADEEPEPDRVSPRRSLAETIPSTS